ncbi:ribonuclease III [Ligilactobacillus hayakitensis DSM 18933 = JCM 14209]|uniref:Ribonuclease 3 n=2 Tax=Ligilactobacillus TaxID=2767887 RepID=A0A0R1WLV5_9LACO|nr:ribonuclease III [Ligilactobacillus hayakitensis]KRM18872.1 ribonuclease III [Ligilactobacillus hayakitensis DSM 18933 = JCM 14209]
MLKGLEQMLKKDFDIEFKNHEILEAAFTHVSYLNEKPNLKNRGYYERIEFLGDAVMQLCVSEYIFKKFPKMPEGKLTRLRAAMVCEDSFSKFATECHFNEYIRLGKGEEKGNARQRTSLLCDIFEAFIGALYYDQGKDAVVKFISKVIFPKLDEGWFDHLMDNKTELQEFLQQNGECKIVYGEVSVTGPDNQRTYTMNVSINGKVMGEGTGRTKKLAEQMAAYKALKKLNK